jgi:transposase
MYSQIQQLKATGLNKAQTARHLKINVKTVKKYWNVDADGFAEIRQKGGSRKKRLKEYEEIVLKWLQEYPDISSAQVTDWLEEHYYDQTVRERTVRRMVSRLRKEHHIDKQPAV